MEYEDEDEEADIFVEQMQARIEATLLAYVPEYAGPLKDLHEYWKDRGPIGPYLLLMDFGDEFLFPELSRHRRASDIVRRAYAAVEALLADEEVIAEAAYFGAIEPLGLAVNYLVPQDVGPRVAEEISLTYPKWPNGRDKLT